MSSWNKADKAEVAPTPARVNDEDVEYIDDLMLEKRTPWKRNTWQHWRSRGVGPRYYKRGRRVIYRWDEVRRWMEENPKGDE